MLQPDTLATQHLAVDETGKKTAPGKPGVYESGGRPPFDSAQDEPHSKGSLILEGADLLPPFLLLLRRR